MLAVKDNIISKLLDKHNSLESIVASVSYNNKDITICLLYIPPDYSVKSYWNTCLFYNHLLIFGGVNLLGKTIKVTQNFHLTSVTEFLN